MFSEPSTWVLISFIAFVTAFGKKLYVIVCAQLDSYISKIDAQIKEAEDIRNEASKLLQIAKERKNKILSEIETIKANTKIELDKIDIKNKEALEQLELKYSSMLKDMSSSALERQKSVLFSQLIEETSNEIVRLAMLNPKELDFNISKKDLLHIKKKVKFHDNI